MGSRSRRKKKRRENDGFGKNSAAGRLEQTVSSVGIAHKAPGSGARGPQPDNDAKRIPYPPSTDRHQRLSVVKANAFHLYSKDGKLMATLTAGDDGAAFCMNDKEGRLRLGIRVDGQEAAVNFFQYLEHPAPHLASRLTLGCVRSETGEAPALLLRDVTGTPRTILAFDKDQSWLEFVRGGDCGSVSWRFDSETGIRRYSDPEFANLGLKIPDIWRRQMYLVQVKNGAAWFAGATGADVERTLRPLAHILDK